MRGTYGGNAPREKGLLCEAHVSFEKHMVIEITGTCQSFIEFLPSAEIISSGRNKIKNRLSQFICNENIHL